MEYTGTSGLDDVLAGCNAGRFTGEISFFFHRNDMFGTPVFTEYWVSFSFSRAQSYVLVVVLFSNCFASYS